MAGKYNAGDSYVMNCIATTPDKNVAKVGIFFVVTLPSPIQCWAEHYKSNSHKIVKWGSIIDKGGNGGGGVLKQ